MLHEHVTTRISFVPLPLFGSRDVLQAGGSWTYVGGSLTWVPSTGNVYLTGSAGRKGTGAYLGGGTTSNPDQSGLSVGGGGFYGLGGLITYTLTGDHTDVYALGTPNWAVGGGYTKFLFSTPPAVIQLQVQPVPEGLHAIPVGGGWHTYTDQDMFGP